MGTFGHKGRIQPATLTRAIADHSGRGRGSWARLGIIALTLAASLLSHRATAGDLGRISLIEENDAFASSDDRHYTQGARLSYLSADISSDSVWNRPFDMLGAWLPVFQDGEGHKRKIEGSIGQSIFTPAEKERLDPDPTDRPYAGWLYTGANLLQDHDGQGLESAELLFGVVGPSSLAEDAQNSWHDGQGFGEARGWKYQLHDEPGLVLSYERKWRFEQALPGRLAVDVVPQVGFSLGNVMTYGAVGGMVRFGQNLAADYGPARIRPSISGSGWFDADRMSSPLGWYVFLATEGRAVGRNIFLDGNTWQHSRSVDKKPLVADIVWGASLFWTDKVRVDFAVTDRTKEFYGQRFSDRFGTITVSCLFF